MSRVSELIKYQKNDITAIANTLSCLIKTHDTKIFDCFAKNYGSDKICKILNTRGFMAYNLVPDNNFDMVDKISRVVISKVSDKKYINAILFSPYYYTKYVQNPSTKQMQEKHLQIAYNTLVNNAKVDIKKNWSLENIISLSNNQDVVLLGIKERQVDATKIFVNGLSMLDLTALTSAHNGYVLKNILPNVAMSNNPEMLQNYSNFQAKYPKFYAELCKVDIEITKQVLQYELENQQIILSDILQKGQKTFVNLVQEYQTKSQKIQKYYQQNQKLLDALNQGKGDSKDFNNSFAYQKQDEKLF